MVDFLKFEKKIGVIFKNKSLLKQAFTHRSYLNEKHSLLLSHNERLEFLGDAVLELVTTEYLFNKFPEKPEGELTSLRAALVNTTMLSKTALSLDMNNFLLLSKGEAKDIGKARQFILANSLEALIGALYLDGGYKTTKEFIEKSILVNLEEVLEKNLWRDAKSFFQEKAQEATGITPQYKVLKEWGPDHNKHFKMGVFLCDDLAGEGEGLSKQEAEQNAASNALETKNWN